MKYYLVILACLFALFFIAALILARPKSILHKVKLTENKRNRFAVAAVAVITALCCIIPMNLSPVWNGEIPAHRDQYEKITESFLEGHLYFDYEPDESLSSLSDPYDPELREKSGAEFKWDHSYYGGKYYMYFGVVPVFLVFLPFRAITGVSLPSYCATQIFTAAFVLGLFMLLYQLSKKMFKEISLGAYLFMSVAFSAMSVWYASAAPALYCTAITAGLAMMVWGLNFWVKAAFFTEKKVPSVIYAALGSLFGALTFGCRPPIALGNIVVLGLMVYYLKHKKHKRKWLDAILFILPYVVIGALLMVYNYVRFGSFTEFGQSYQLTYVSVKDMPKLIGGSLKDSLRAVVLYITNIGRYLIRTATLDKFLDNGTFITFPILIYIFIGIANGKCRELVKKEKLRWFLTLLCATPVLILLLDVMGSPSVTSRYRMDTFWIFGILAFVFIGLIYSVRENKVKFSSFICYFSLFTILVSVIMFAYPNDMNFTEYYFGDIHAIASKIIN